MSIFDRDHIWKELEEKGYCIIPDVVSQATCDQMLLQMKNWASTQRGLNYTHQLSLINIPRIGHLEVAWQARLFAKDLFAKIWGTDKLVSSFDRLSFSSPPESGTDDFDNGYSWLHVDRDGRRRGLHAVQAGVYLEETVETDQCLRVMEGSIKFTDEFFTTHPEASKKSEGIDYYRLTDDEVEWYKSKGCVRKTIPVPKGAMVVWDTRTVHDNVKATKGRPNSGRWRFVVFVCMLPAIWASEEDIKIKRYAYENMLLTCHMPCMKVRMVGKDESIPDDIKAIEELPDIAKTLEVKRLVGIEQYDFNDGKPNGPPEVPKWL